MSCANVIHIQTGIPGDLAIAADDTVISTSGHKYVNDAQLFGAIDGVNRDFSLPDRVVDGTLSLFLNGQRLTRGEDFDYSGSAVMLYFELQDVLGALPRDVVRAEYFAERRGC